MLLAVECAAVVKANAYGCGLEPVTRALANAGCKTFFVADLAEARRVRAVRREAAIYVLNGFIARRPRMRSPRLNARPVINSPSSSPSGTPSSPRTAGAAARRSTSTPA